MKPDDIELDEWRPLDEQFAYFLSKRGTHISEHTRHATLAALVYHVEDYLVFDAGAVVDKESDRMHVFVRRRNSMDIEYECSVSATDGVLIITQIEPVPAHVKAFDIRKRWPKPKTLKLNEPLLGTRPGKR